jgi:drug/metabolite transporter (DMT)-like permease
LPSPALPINHRREGEALTLKLGIFYAVLSAFFSALMGVFVKLIGNAVPLSVLVFSGFATSLILVVPWLIRDRTFRLKVPHPWLYLTRSIAGLASVACFLYVAKLMPLVDAILLNSTAPLFVPVVAVVLTKARTPRSVWGGVALGFLGVVLVLHPGPQLFQLDSMIGLSAGLLFAIAIVQGRTLLKTSSPTQLLFYYWVIGAANCGIVAFLQWRFPSGRDTWALLGGLGLCSTLTQVFAALSYARAPVRLTSSLIFLGLVFAGLFDWLVWKEVPGLLTLIGIAVVILGAVITILAGEQDLAKTAK